MHKEAIEKNKKKFKQLYIDTIKHEQDVRKCIESGIRKKGDIRRSLERLDNKYKKLVSLKKEFEEHELYEAELLKNITSKDKYSLIQLENRIKRLYGLAGVKRDTVAEKESQPIYGDEIYLVTDIPGNLEMLGLTKRKKIAKNKKEKNKRFNVGKLGRRVASLIMALSMTIFAGSISKNAKDNFSERQNNSYTDTNRENEKENFRETLYVDVAEDIQRETITQLEINSQNKPKQYETKDEIIKDISKEEKRISIADEESNYYLAKANAKYTEVSDGSENVGYFSKNTEVKVYNRALVKTDKNGNKQILEVTKIGQTWKEYAKENGLNYDEFKEYMNNKNIQKCVSLQSSDGKYDYGWVLEDTLEKIGEVER